jgi:hypothetical protein
LFEQDIISQHHHPYCLITPPWLHDYFVMNRFAACALFVTEIGMGFAHIYALDGPADDIVSDLGPPRGGIAMGVAVIAEKGSDSTFNRVPIQDQYRSEADWIVYRDNLAALDKLETAFQFGKPTRLELDRLGRRVSSSFRYLGVIRPPGGEEAAEQLPG